MRKQILMFSLTLLASPYLLAEVSHNCEISKVEDIDSNFETISTVKKTVVYPALTQNKKHRFEVTETVSGSEIYLSCSYDNRFKPLAFICVVNREDGVQLSYLYLPASTQKIIMKTGASSKIDLRIECNKK